MENIFSLRDLLRPTTWLVYLPLIFPLYLVKLDIAGVPINVLELAILILFVFFLVAELGELWRGSIGARGDRRLWMKGIWAKHKWFWLGTGAFLLISLLAVWIVPRETMLIDGQTLYESRKVAWGIFKGWIVLPYLYFTMMWFGFRRQSELYTSLYAYIFSVLPLALWAFYQYFTGQFITADSRASGPFVNANYLAMYLVPAVTALWVLIVRGVLLGFHVRRFVTGMILAMLYTVALLMTHSYAAIGAVMLALLVFLITAFRLHARYQKHEEIDLLKKIAYFLGVFALIAVMAASVLYVGTEKWRLFTDFQDRSSSGVRLQVYQIDADFVLHNPLLGIGFGQYEPKYNLEAPLILGHAPYEWVMIHPHDTLLAVWLNLGLAGVILFVSLLVLMCRGYFLADTYEEKFFRLIGLSMLLAISLHGLVDTYIFKNDLAMVFWLIVALTLLPRKFSGSAVK